MTRRADESTVSRGARRVRATRRRARSALALSLAAIGAGVSACRTWRAEPLPRAVGGAAAPERTVRGPVRVTRPDGWRVELREARVAGDTVQGPLRERAAGGPTVTFAVPLDSVRRLEARRFSAARTAALAGGILLGFLTLAGAVVAAAATPGY